MRDTIRHVFFISPIILLLLSSALDALSENTSMGPLTVHNKNSCYFSNGIGKPVYLTGSHTWNNFQDIIGINRVTFDYEAYLDFLQDHNHNFMRLWTWEQAAWLSNLEEKVVFEPMPYQRIGPGKAFDGNLKFDLTQFNENYFARLRSRVLEAQNRGIYVSVMLFQGWSIEIKDEPPKHPALAYFKRFLSKLGLEYLLDSKNNPWRGHPFNRQNNINGIDGDPGRNGDGRDVHTLKHPRITRLQEEYVKNVIDTLNDLDNVLWEISNESHVDSTLWQYHFIDFIREYEKTKEKIHPIIMTVQYPEGDNEVLFKSLAEAVSPNQEGGFRDNTAIADGRKIIINDTDHLWGIGGDWKWVWKSFLNGMNPVFMDPYTMPDPEFEKHPSRPDWDLLRKNMGYTRAYAERVDLEKMTPRPDLCSSGFCLARKGHEYLVYIPALTDITVDLSETTGNLVLEWLDPTSGSKLKENLIKGNEPLSFQSPFKGDAILYILEGKTN